MFISFTFSSGQICKESFEQESKEWERDLLWNESMTLALLTSIFRLPLLTLVTFSASFPRDLCLEHLHASWAFPRGSCLWVSGSVAVWPWNDLQSDFFLQQICIFISVDARMVSLAICGLKGGKEMQYNGKQARRFPYFKHLIVHLLIIFCTDIEQVINLFFYLLFFT